MKTLDVATFTPSDSVENTLRHIVSALGKKFTVKCGDILLPSIMSKSKGGVYILESLSEKKFLSYQIIFIDYTTQKVEDGCYISVFHKTEQYTGTQIIESVLQLLKVIGVKRCTLIDGATVECPSGKGIGLSFLKILQGKGLFYERFGFELALYPSFKTAVDGGNNIDIIKKKLKKSITKLKKIYTEDLIAASKDFILFVIDCIYSGKEIFIYQEKPNKFELGIEQVWKINRFAKLLIKNYTPGQKLTETLLEIFEKDCDGYSKIIKEFDYFNQAIYAVCGKEKRDLSPFLEPIKDIHSLLDNCVFVKEFE